MKKINYFLLAAMVLGSINCVSAIDVRAPHITDDVHSRAICQPACSARKMRWNGNWTNISKTEAFCGCYDEQKKTKSTFNKFVAN